MCHPTLTFFSIPESRSQFIAPILEKGRYTQVLFLINVCREQFSNTSCSIHNITQNLTFKIENLKIQVSADATLNYKGHREEYFTKLNVRCTNCTSC